MSNEWFNQFLGGAAAVEVTKTEAQSSVTTPTSTKIQASAPPPDVDWFEGKDPPAVNPPESVENVTPEMSKETHDQVVAEKASGKPARGRPKKTPAPKMDGTFTEATRPLVGLDHADELPPVVLYVQCIPMNAAVPDYTEVYFGIAKVIFEKTGKHPAELSFGENQRVLTQMFEECIPQLPPALFVPRGAPYADLFVAVCTAKGAVVIRGVW